MNTARILFGPDGPIIVGKGEPIRMPVPGDAELFAQLECDLPVVADVTFVSAGQTKTAAEAFAEIEQCEALAEAIAALATDEGETH